MPNPRIVDVGLPRSGTQSFTAACEALGLRAAHIGYGEDDLAAQDEFQASGTGPILDFMTEFDAVSDSPYYGLIEALRAHHPDISLVATTRSRDTWLESIRNHPQAGATFMRRIFGSEDPEQIFDRHDALLREHGVPRLALEWDDTTRWGVLVTILGVREAPDREWPRIDRIGGPGFRIDALAFDRSQEPAS